MVPKRVRAGTGVVRKRGSKSLGDAEKPSRAVSPDGDYLEPYSSLVSEGDSGVRGAQSLRRAVAVLRAVSQFGDRGCRPKLVSEQTGLSLATTDRLLRVLADERLLERHGPEKLYRIGPEIVFLAAVRGPQFSLGDHYDAAMRDLTSRIKETTYTWLRVGDAATCLERYESNHPIRVLSGDVGVRRPLGVGASTLAILGFLPQEEMLEVIKRNRRIYSAYGVTADDVRRMADKSRELGYAVHDHYFVPEVASVALPVRNSAGEVLGSIGVITFQSRFTDELRDKYISQLKRVLDTVPPPED